MRKLFSNIDRLLRGEFTRQDELSKGQVGGDAGTLVLAAVLLGVIYGVFMGLYGVLRPTNATYLQLLASTVKVPLLFLLTLVVTFPSLYVFSALLGSPLRFLESLRLLLGGIVVNLALLASLGPVTGFFTVSTDSYPFMIVLNVVFFAVSGFAGLAVVYRALDLASEGRLLVVPEGTSEGEPPVPVRDATSGASSRGRAILVVWMFVYGAVGAQMGWILRPVVGAPDQEFTFFRERTSNFFEAFFQTLGRLFSQ